MNSEQRLLVLGAGRYQLRLIKQAEKRGIRTVISDYLTDSPGRVFCSYQTMTDMMDIDANIALGREYEVAGVITSGTDQALNTMAATADALQLPCYLTPQAANICTNKQAMTQVMERAGLPRPRSLIVNREKPIQAKAMHLHYPVVIKPTDAQGQRGTSVIETPDRFSSAIEAALDASRSGNAIIEEFIIGPEITVCAWLHNGDATLLTVTDRVTYNAPPAVGVCFQHIFPSRHAAQLTGEIRTLMADLGAAYGVSHGPLYVQMIVGHDQLYFVEGSCRVGGGHEDSLIPLVTGINITDLLIDLALTGRAAPLDYSFDPKKVKCHALVNFILARPGSITAQSLPNPDTTEGLAENGYYYRKGYEQGKIVNALGRIGYFICTAPGRETLMQRARTLYDNHHVNDDTGNEMIFWPDDPHMIGR
ncbi:MAG: ATP-grasp domain-containing protein [gamma proteobacterium endosymbiont of Lamellibrachia anaximandri]|nr:ATP-grasp domain-containing protein [gamma proteobacterium endosymbiont of Lamellibrachia anaximandri]MBL3617351.1 ATP-grasp domain-containing protein [gamma proteobacterium endosymbiont of Lamellibrachia anaximandri]